MSRLATVVIKALTVIAFVLILLVQVFLIPEAAQSSAVMYPIFAYLAVPGIIGCVAVLACVQVVLVCVWRLVDLASAGRIFNGRALVWVDVIIGAIWAAVALVLIGEVSLVMIGAAPPFAFWATVIAVVFGAGTALVVGILRALLRQATTLRNELEEVV